LSAIAGRKSLATADQTPNILPSRYGITLLIHGERAVFAAILLPE
jgi:hypothetical protein